MFGVSNFYYFIHLSLTSEAVLTFSFIAKCQSKNPPSVNKIKTTHTDQQLKEEPGIFVRVLSADPSADDHLQGQLLMKLLQERKYKNCGEKQLMVANGIKNVLLNMNVTMN